MRTFAVAFLLAASLPALATPSHPQKIPDVVVAQDASRRSIPAGVKWGAQERRHHRVIPPRADSSRVETDVNRDGRSSSHASGMRDKLTVEADRNRLAERAGEDGSGAFSTLQSGISGFIQPEHPTSAYGPLIEYRAQRKRELIELLMRSLAELD